MHLIDTHAHLDHLDDLDDAMKSAAAQGVTDIVAMSMDAESARKTWEIKQRITAPRIHLAVGVHPVNAAMAEAEQCAAFAREHRDDLAAIGEIGLDFWYKWVRKDQQKHEEQREVFRLQLDLARELDLPVVIHCRGKWRECLDSVRERGLSKVNFHWYSGPVDVIKDIIAAGYFVSTTPAVAYSRHSREAMSEAPAEQTLIETDCPVSYKISPDGEERFAARPKDVGKTLEAYCELKGRDPGETAEILNANARKFFDLR